VLQKVTEDFDSRWHFNTSIAAMMELTNDLYAEEAKISAAAMEQVITIFVFLLAPFAPYLAQEIWAELGKEGPVFRQAWPAFNPDLARETDVEIPVQVNGKIRARFTVPTGLDKAALEAAVRKPAHELHMARPVVTLRAQHQRQPHARQRLAACFVERSLRQHHVLVGFAKASNHPARRGQRIGRGCASEQAHQHLRENLRLALATHAAERRLDVSVAAQQRRRQRAGRPAPSDQRRRPFVQREGGTAVLTEDARGGLEHASAEGVKDALDDGDRMAQRILRHDGHRIAIGPRSRWHVGKRLLEIAGQASKVLHQRV